MIQTNAPTARAQLAGLVNTSESIDVAFANGAFTAPGGHPTALVKRQISGGGMTSDDLDGGFLLPVASPADVASRWERSVVPQRPDFIKMVLVYSEDRLAKIPVPADSDRYGLDPHCAGDRETGARGGASCFRACRERKRLRSSSQGGRGDYGAHGPASGPTSVASSTASISTRLRKRRRVKPAGSGLP